MSEARLMQEQELGSTDFLERLQRAITRRLELPYDQNEPVAYEFSQDRAMLHQYYLLRAKQHDRMFDEAPQAVQEGLHDKLSHILLARRGRLCLGGLRLTLREADEQWSLPCEQEGFSLRQAFKDLPLRHLRHGEISGIALMEDCGEPQLADQLCKHIIDKAVSAETAYLFVRSNAALARSLKLVGTQLGASTRRQLQDPEGMAYITLFDLSPFCNAQEVAAARAALAKPNLSLVE